jgi:hypothetical protein
MSSTKTFYSLGNNKKLVKLRNSNITTLQLTFVTVYDKGFHIYCRSKQWLQLATLSVQKKKRITVLPRETRGKDTILLQEARV